MVPKPLFLGGVISSVQSPLAAQTPGLGLLWGAPESLHVRRLPGRGAERCVTQAGGGGPRGLCLAPQRLPGLPWGRASTYYPWATAAFHERPTRPTRMVPPPGSLPQFPLLHTVHRLLPFSDLGSLVKCEVLLESSPLLRQVSPYHAPTLHHGLY